MGLKEVLAAVRSPDPAARKGAVVQLARSKNPRAIPYLRHVADTDPVADLRYVARKGIQFIQDAQGGGGPPGPRPSAPEVPAALRDPRRLAAALQAEDPKVRLQAARVVVADRSRTLLPLLKERLSQETDPMVAATLLEAMGQIGDPTSLDVMKRWLQHPEPRVRANAIEAIGSLESDRGFHYLIPHLRDPDNRCRGNAVLVLRRHGPVNVFRTLEGMITSDSASMQDSATFCLGRLGQGSEVFRLLQLAMSSRYTVTRNQARAVLRRMAERGIDRATEVLRRVGAEDEDAAVDDLLENAEVVEAPQEERYESEEEASARILQGLTGLADVPTGAWTDHRESRAETVAERLERVAEASGESELSEPERKADALRNSLASLGNLAGEPPEEDDGGGVLARLQGLSQLEDPGVDVRAARATTLLNSLKALSG